MRNYVLQANAVRVMIDEHFINSGFALTETYACLQDAITTLNAAALTKEKLSITEDLIRIAQEFVIDAPSMDLTELVCYQNEFRKILDKLNHK